MKRTASAQMEHWDATLARALSAGGRPLRTLRDAGLYLTDNYELLSPSLALEDAIDLLGRAAETGDHADIVAATEQVARFLRSRFN